MSVTTTLALSEFDRVLRTATDGVIGVIFEDDGITLTDHRLGGAHVFIAKPAKGESEEIPPAKPEAPSVVDQASNEELLELLAAAVKALELRGVGTAPAAAKTKPAAPKAKP